MPGNTVPMQPGASARDARTSSGGLLRGVPSAEM